MSDRFRVQRKNLRTGPLVLDADATSIKLLTELLTDQPKVSKAKVKAASIKQQKRAVKEEHRRVKMEKALQDRTNKGGRRTW